MSKFPGTGVAELEAALASYDAHTCTQVELAAAVGSMLQARGWRWNPALRRHTPPQKPAPGEPRPTYARAGFLTVADLQRQLTRLATAAARLTQDAQQQRGEDRLTVSRSAWEVLRGAMPPGYGAALEPRQPPPLSEPIASGQPA